jgi:hypothetical protein
VCPPLPPCTDMLMLIVMTFNMGLILSTVAGFVLGALAFGHMGESQYTKGGGVVINGVSPASEDDLEVHFVDPQSCCNTRQV